MDLKQKIKKVNTILLKGEPGNISSDSVNGHVGYKIQYVMDAMNEVFGVTGWSFSYSDGVVHEGRNKKIMVVDVNVTFFVKTTGGKWAGLNSTGQADIDQDNIGDAKKAAFADGVKKALAYGSIGNRAYLGGLEKVIALAVDANSVAGAAEALSGVECERCDKERLTKSEAAFAKQVFGKVIGRLCQEKVQKNNAKKHAKFKRSGKKRK